MRVGIIDVGTNSIHLLIVEGERRDRCRVLLSARHLTRLGDRGLAAGRLTRAASHRALVVLQRYAKTLTRYRVERVEAVATSAVREARNGRAFVRRVRARTGVPLRVISGEAEARLIDAGIRRVNRLSRPALMIAIGGGSAEIVCGDGTRARYASSLPLGGARLAQRFIRHDPPRPREVEALVRYTHRAWGPAARALRGRVFRQALGGSAGIAQLSAAVCWHRHRRLPRPGARLTISQGTLRRFIRWLAGSTAAERRRLRGVDPRRQDLLLPGGVALLTCMERLGVSSLRSVPGSLREGLIVEAIAREALC